MMLKCCWNVFWTDHLQMMIEMMPLFRKRTRTWKGTRKGVDETHLSHFSKVVSESLLSHLWGTFEAPWSHPWVLFESFFYYDCLSHIIFAFLFTRFLKRSFDRECNAQNWGKLNQLSQTMMHCFSYLTTSE